VDESVLRPTDDLTGGIVDFLPTSMQVWINSRARSIHRWNISEEHASVMTPVVISFMFKYF
jgi:hypothetical protein